MYLSHYNLEKEPFQITADPDFLWLGEQHLEALSTLQYGIQENKGFLLLTGDVGTGKTVLINRLVSMLNVESIVATLPDPGLDVLDFFNHLSETFQMGQTFESKGAFLSHLRKFLHKTAAQNKSVLLIIDEAQQLNHELLEEIRLLSNIELNNQKLINIFFVGQTEFNNTLMEENNKAVRHRIAVRYHIYPLNEKETGEYIRHRLKVAGSEQKIFTTAAIEEIFSFSGGNPRLTNIICDHALLTGYSADLNLIDADVIKECASELRLPTEKRKTKEQKQKIAPKSEPQPEETVVKSTRLITASAIAVVAVLFAFAAYWLYSKQSETKLPWSIEEMAPKGPKGVGEQKIITEKPPADISEEKKPEVKAPVEPFDTEKTLQLGAFQAESAPEGIQPELDFKNVEKIIIYFNHNSNDLPEKTYKTLDRVASVLLENPGMDINVTGYTDSSGSLSYNVSISKFRANIIKTYLAGKGVSPSRITALGLGPENPIASNETAEGKRQNRRVEIEFNRSPVE
ncbi:MAG: AAA family ATPase [Deltaproteobacteria bacterium]|nr:MAG: AAA family ATPase [Deltaproteobacteria bacterium]